MSERETFTCYTCGWQWKRGENGNHDCLSRVVAQRDELKAQVMAWINENAAGGWIDDLRKERNELRRENLRLEREMNQLRCARK